MERERASLVLLRRNLERVGNPSEARVAAGDALQPGTWGADAFPADLVLADPPYRRGWPERFLAALAGREALAEDGRLVIEHETGAEPVHEAWEPLQRRRYGDTTLSFYRWAAAAPSAGE